MDVYVGTSESVELRIFAGGNRVDSAGPVSATLYDEDGTEIASESAEIVSAGTSGESHEYYTFPIELAQTASEASYTLIWEYQPTLNLDATRTDVIDVVKPYAQPDQVRQEFPFLEARSYNEIKAIERVVRYTINSFTGQGFGKAVGKTHTIAGSGGHALWLPQRLIQATAVNGLISGQGPGVSVASSLRLLDEGWVLAFPNPAYGYRDVKADIGLGYNSAGIFHSTAYYTVTGDWGWENVPAEVQQAATVLTGRYFEPEQNWRRYNVDNIRANDWRMEFSKTSSETTGDADVDLMLQKYKVPAYGVV